MHEFDSLSVSTYEASSLAGKLTEKSSDGWEVVAIVPTGSDVVAYLKRTATGTTSATETAAAAPAADTGSSWGATSEPAAATPPAAAEPAGWGSAPEATPPAATSWGSGASDNSGSSWGSTGGGDTTAQTSGWGTSATPTPAAAPAPAPAAAPSTPAVPPGWYADPAGRYELRYWDGSAWTEHVSRAGQQYTDPPVA